MVVQTCMGFKQLRGTEERAIAHEDRVCSLKFHPELGHIVASGAINGKIRIVNTMSGSAECIARGEEVVTSATWNAAGDALAVGCDGGTLRVFLFQPKMSLMERLERQSFHSFGSERSQKVLPGANVLVLLCPHMYQALYCRALDACLLALDNEVLLFTSLW